MSRLSRNPLLGVAVELEQLQVEARTWEAESDVMLARMGVQPGWTCVDLGCGAMGILAPLGPRVGPRGRVISIDLRRRQLAAAHPYLAREGLTNVRLRAGDPCHTELPRASFDLVHARFLFGLHSETQPTA